MVHLTTKWIKQTEFHIKTFKKFDLKGLPSLNATSQSGQWKNSVGKFHTFNEIQFTYFGGMNRLVAALNLGKYENWKKSALTLFYVD